MDERKFDAYIIGPLSRPDDMKKAALYYLSHDYSVKMLTVNTTIGECFEDIDRCSFVVVATESGIYALTEYCVEYAKRMEKGIVIWKGESENE
jgi:hypothetical protein